MARTPSTMVPLGTKAPDFKLPDPSGKIYARDDFTQGAGLLVMFICNHCPFVKHMRAELAEFARDYQPKGLHIVAINSNDTVTYPDDSPPKMAEEILAAGYTFPYLVDETQAIAKAYQAACTPDFYLFDPNLALVYRGQFDPSRPGSGIPVTGRDLRAACDALLSGDPPRAEQMPSIGCNIKWKPGNEPS